MKKTVLIILLICWMVVIFMFSNQSSEKSSNVSESSINFILDKLSITREMSYNDKTQVIENLQTPIRKLAHFSIYAVGGLLSFALVNQYKLPIKNKVVYSFIFCLAYSITDEIHQYFIPGRSCEIRDILIDSFGVLFGILISYLVIKIFSKF